MVVHRRQLPILSPCTEFVPPPGAADLGGFCEHCQREVHDVSKLREAELRSFLAARVGTRVCLAYRTDPRGYVELRRDPVAPTLALGALALLLAACAGHATELETPGTGCYDEDGYAVACSTWLDPSMHSVPSAVEVSGDFDGGCPVRPTAEAYGGEQSVEPEALDEALDESLAEALDEPTATRPTLEASDPAASPEVAGTEVHARVNFSIDPDDEMVRGMIVVGAGGWIDRDFVPTKTLWKQWRQRRAEQKAARARWRASRD